MKYYQFERVKDFIDLFDIREGNKGLYINKVKSIGDLKLKIRTYDIGKVFKDTSYSEELSTFKFTYKKVTYTYKCKFEETYVKLQLIKEEKK